VGEDVIAKAKELELENYIINNHLDLIAIIQKQFNSIGIPSKHIEIDNHCTACSTNNYYSYRKEGITGRFAGVIYLK
jgi:copper oxidase (laccase) domain-containing protein